MQKRIYIVDDDESVCRALKLLMTACGFVAEAFTSAEAFFKAVPHSAPGCLILDVFMPGLSGWDAQRVIKEKSGRSVIIISGYTDADLTARALRQGAVGFLQKPFNDRELVDLVNEKCFKQEGEICGVNY